MTLDVYCIHIQTSFKISIWFFLSFQVSCVHIQTSLRYADVYLHSSSTSMEFQNFVYVKYIVAESPAKRIDINEERGVANIIYLYYNKMHELSKVNVELVLYPN